MPVLLPFHAFIDGLVHADARPDAVTALRHRAFLASHLFAGVLALAGLPLYLALYGAPGSIEVAAFGWLVAPLALVWYLSKTGRLETAYVLSAANHTALAVTIAAATGGPSSFALAWLVVVPIEAAMSASRRVVLISSAVAAGGMLVLLAAAVLALLPPTPALLAESNSLVLLAVLTATLYGTGLALGAGALARTGDRLLRLGDARYRLLAEHMTDLITRHAPNGAVTFVSPASETLLGVPPGELVSQGLFSRVLVADRPAYLSAMARATSDGADVAVEFRLRRSEAPAAEGGFIWVEMRCRPLDAPARSSARHQVVAVTRDISERKRQEAALEAARSEAERANVAKSRFLATMSHELRTPLNAIIGFAELLGNEGLMNLDADRRQGYARLIHESGLHLLAVVNGILDMSRIESGNFEICPEPCAIAPVVETCREMMALRASEGGLTLTTQVPPDLPEIVADKRALKQVLINLLSNAIKFTRPGGTVMLRAVLEAGEIVLSVADTGIGIAQQDLPRLGDPFFQSGTSYDRPYEGTGLGLSVVKGLVGLHAGRLEIASRLGEGTTVTVRLPRDCEAAQRREAGEDVVLLQSRRAPSSNVAEPSEIGVRKRA